MSDMSRSEPAVYQVNKTIADKFLPINHTSNLNTINPVSNHCVIISGRHGRHLFDARENQVIAKMGTDLKTLVVKDTEFNSDTEMLLDRLEADAFMHDIKVEHVKPNKFIIPKSLSKVEAFMQSLNTNKFINLKPLMSRILVFKLFAEA